MSDDFENKLSALLNQQVDHELGERRPAPPMRRPAQTSSATSRRRSTPWVMPLLAAACVAALVGGGIGVSQLVSNGSNPASNRRPTVDATHTAPPSKPTDTPTSAVRSTPSTHAVAPPPARTTTSQSAPPPQFTMAGFQGAQIAVPQGWTLVDNGDTTSQDGQSATYFWAQRACLQPLNAPKDSNCRIVVQHIHPPTGTPASTIFDGIDVDRLGPVGPGDPGEYDCNPNNPNAYTPSTGKEYAADSTFGGRPADLRVWKRYCNGKLRYVEAHYVVASPSAYDLYLDDYKDPATFDKDLAALQTIAQHSQLPAADGGVRYMDRGIIRSEVVGQTTVTIAIDRVIATRQGDKSVYLNHNPETYSYTVPLALWNSAKVKVGERVVITTDGSAAITLAKDVG